MSIEKQKSGGMRRSSVVAISAFAVWLGSLCFDTYVPYGTQANGINGLVLLTVGWIGLFGLSVAWLANPCLLIALVRDRNGGADFAMAAALLALDALRLNSYPTGSGGSDTIYGYGAGFALWLASMGLALVATGMRVREARTDPDPANANALEWARELGIVWLVALVAGFGAFAVTDRMQAAAAEKERLRSVLIKRGPVCSREPPVAAGTLVSPTIVEIAGQGGGYPFDGPRYLLEWGVPIVRMRGHDYAYTGTGIERMTRITKARGEPSAVLHYSSESRREGAPSAIRIRLLATDGRELVDHLWAPDGPTYHYCPDYQQVPRADQQPRKVIMEALALPDRRDPPQPNFWDTVARVKGNVTGREPAAGMEWVNNNAGCPRDIGFSYERARKEKIEGSPFFVGDGAYAGAGPGIFSACSGNVVYVYNMGRRSGDFFLTISKRALTDLERMWSIHIEFANADPALQEGSTRIVSIAEETGTLRIRTRHSGHDQLLVIEAPLPAAREAGLK